MSWWLAIVAIAPLVVVFAVALVLFVTRVDQVEPAPLESGEPRAAVRAAMDRSLRED